jgi:hypothetical protein
MSTDSEVYIEADHIHHHHFLNIHFKDGKISIGVTSSDKDADEVMDIANTLYRISNEANLPRVIRKFRRELRPHYSTKYDFSVYLVIQGLEENS